MKRAAFLDRDGVINVEHGYVHTWDAFEFVPGSVDAMRRLHEAGYALVVITNQSGLARGMYTEAQYQALTQRLSQHLAEQGVPLAAVYHCPHHPGGSVPALAVDCDCRKPAPGMLLRAQRELDLSLADSLLVGDKGSDAEAGRRAGVGRVMLVHSGHALAPEDVALADSVHADLGEAVAHALAQPACPTP
ncbi:MAG: D-glycero-beta-D-manno-heptose 1,7-bisphosphate 7-phosphatase [Aquincola sp.]|uniref:D-glycero-beta-D-manno-heptose 1,7-bisphosphate 7-phosphatase n=1 Tax=uncultured Aquincola sp. TaxID=886556 RepID=UPI0032B28B38|nr:D-glycero-beta-D-manno-heptose 1,7-bisphosphate 7-phosphatase [Aquincola sp.]